MNENVDLELEEVGLTRESFEKCLHDIRDKVNGINDMDWEEIVEKYGLKISRDCVRKASSAKPFGFVFVENYYGQNRDRKLDEITKQTQAAYLKVLKEEKAQIKLERQKLSDEKLELNRWLREQSRDDLIFEKIQNQISLLPKIFVPDPIIVSSSAKTGILCFADTHYGTEYEIKGLDGEIINKYSPEVFEERMNKLLSQTVTKIKKEGFTSIKVYDLGDEIDGILRCSQLMKLRYGVIEQTIRYADYICNWLAKLSEYVNVEYYMTYGNHSELRMINQPKGTFKDDNLGKVVKEFIKIRLAENTNFTLIDNETGLIFDNVYGYNILGIHGEVKNMEKAISDFSNVYNKRIDVLIGGHMHHTQTAACGINRDVISVPSVIGVDDYSMSLLKASNPGATFIIIEDGSGVVEQTTFKF